MLDLREYLDRNGRGRFGEWFEGLHAEAARRVTTALYRLWGWEISPMSKVSARESSSTASISVPVIASTSARMASAS